MGYENSIAPAPIVVLAKKEIARLKDAIQDAKGELEPLRQEQADQCEVMRHAELNVKAKEKEISAMQDEQLWHIEFVKENDPK